MPAPSGIRPRKSASIALSVATSVMLFLLPALACLLSGCLYTTHHFNTGRLLDPGQTSVTIGYGRTPLYSVDCASRRDEVMTDSTGTRCRDPYAGNGNGPDTTSRDPLLTTEIMPKVSFGYRLGVRGPWGPFTGVEMGWQFEVPTNPMSVEFDMKVGLPVPAKHPAFRHSLSAGWIIGMWADNSWFSEYAASRAFGEHALYGNYRVTYLATQPDEVGKFAAKGHFGSSNRFAQQASLGFYLKLPEIFLLPDYLSPQATFTMPVVPPFTSIPHPLLDDYEWNVNFGFGWNFK